MKYCDKCKVAIVGERKFCPLCQGLVTNMNHEKENVIHDKEELFLEEEEVFPEIPTIYKQYHLFFRILIFLSIVISTVAVLINFTLLRHTGFWSVFVLAGVTCFWFNVAFAVRKRSNILKNIMYQLVTISLTAIFWDVITGWNQWSITYFFPILLSVSVFAMAIVAFVMKQYIEDQIIYFCIDSSLGIIPLVCLLLGCLEVVLPAVISVAVCVITMAALLVFQGDILKNELKKRLHV